MGKVFFGVLAGVLVMSTATFSAVTGSDSRTSPSTGGSSRTGTTTGSDSDMDTTTDSATTNRTGTNGRLYPTYTDKTQRDKDAMRKSRRAKSGGQMIPTDEAGPSSVGSGPDSDMNVQPSPSPGSRF